MAQSFFKVDGKYYNVGVSELKRSASVLDGENAGRVKSGAMIRDIIGTYYNYTVTLDPRNLSDGEYDSLYQTLTAPVDSHDVVFPYGQSTLSFKAYVSGAEDTLVKTDDVTGKNLWSGLSITFTAMKPQRLP